MTTQLLSEFQRLNLSELDGVNLLVNHSIISDTIIFASEIPQPDLAIAISFLKTL